MGEIQAGKNKYRMTQMHRELLGHFIKGEGLGYQIYEMDAVKKRIRYCSLEEDSEEICYLRGHGIELCPDSGKSDEKREKNDLYNTLAIREFINENNSWTLSFFVKNLFAPLIRMGMDAIKEMDNFGLICKMIESELDYKDLLLQRRYDQANLEGKKVDTDCIFADKDLAFPGRQELLDEYVGGCRGGEKLRWEVLKDQMKRRGVKKEEYIRIDRVFGMIGLFESIMEDYMEYIRKDINRQAEKLSWEEA